jgi:hypothetical protein
MRGTPFAVDFLECEVNHRSLTVSSWETARAPPGSTDGQRSASRNSGRRRSSGRGVRHLQQAADSGRQAPGAPGATLPAPKTMRADRTEINVSVTAFEGDSSDGPSDATLHVAHWMVNETTATQLTPASGRAASAARLTRPATSGTRRASRSRRKRDQTWR